MMQRLSGKKANGAILIGSIFKSSSILMTKSLFDRLIFTKELEQLSKEKNQRNEA
jgi:hypothetical protein